MRGRRPSQFSDTTVEQLHPLDRSLLEYHLSTLTSRNQETEFANFARKLSQHEICPNLLPQTGPTGGGDSRVDSETYPVAEVLTHAWYIGINQAAASERWAFAFSAKKDWRAKVIADVAKLVGTNRGYAKAFFITNQFVRDKERAEVEGDLRKTHGLDVRILDRNWILDRVFEGHHESLAIDELRIEVTRRAAPRKGPLDTAREADLAQLEERIKQALQDGRLGFQLVEDMMEAALLARGLERPRPEVDGLLERARRNAAQCGTDHQRLVSAYNHTWTSFWWYEDYKLLGQLYGDVETLAKGSRNAYELELLSNLWLLLQGAVTHGWLTPDEARLEQRRSTLTAELERLSQEVDRPSTALQARTLLLQNRLHPGSGHDTEAVLKELEQGIRESEGLVGYPFESVAKLIMEMGPLFEESPAFASLFDTLVEATARRDGEIAGAQMLVERGAQQLQAGRPYEAIRTLGRSLAQLHRHESRDDVVRALFLCASAYERVGLLWAARGTLLRAASIATNEFWTYEQVTRPQIICYNRMKWLELQLGRVPHALAWHELELVLRPILVGRGYNPARLSAGDLGFDACLGILFLRSDTWRLQRLARLPDVLDRLRLHNCAVALWYALGYDDKIPDASASETPAERLEFFRVWRDQPAGQDLPLAADWYDTRATTLASVVLGCHITVGTTTERVCVEAAEAVLGAIEGFMATMVVDGGAAREPSLTIKMRRSDFAEQPISFDLREVAGQPHLDVTCGPLDHEHITVETQRQIQDVLVDLIAHVCARLFILPHAKDSLEKLIRDEQAMTRAVNFAASHSAINNVLGHEPRLSLDAWFNFGAPKEYPLKRSEEWDAHDRRAQPPPVPSPAEQPLKPVKDEPPPELLDLDTVKHGAITVLSLIREPLWDEAKWEGVVLGTSGPSAPPVLAPFFRNRKASALIFDEWRKELGPRDEKQRLRLTIVRGIRVTKPSWYRFAIGSNIPPERDPGQSHFVGVCRVHTMTPDTDANLVRFLESYKQVGSYILTHAVWEEGSAEPVLMANNYIVKTDLSIRDAWEIGRNDLDAIGVHVDDDPIIPKDIDNAPVLELLRWKKEQADRHG